MKAFYIQLKNIIHFLRPSNRIERTVIIVLMAYFSIISILFFWTSRPEDAGLLGYDTVGHLTVSDMKIGSENILNWNIRHPLFRLLYLPVIIVNEGLLLFGINLTWPLFLGSSVCLMSCSGLFIFKTLQAINLSVFHTSLLLALFCSFAHTMMLSIQVDSFVMSMLFGSMMVLLFVTRFHSSVSDNLLFLGIAGTTSTNFFKFVFYQLLEECSLAKTIKRFLKSIPLFCVFFALTIPNLITRIVEHPRGLIYAVMGNSFYFQGSDFNKWILFFENFLCEPILFHHTTGIIYSHETIHLPSYPNVWCYIPITIIFLLLVASVVVNRHHHLIHLFCCCFSFDLLMHFGIGYGIEEAQLFCGHWLFFVPIVIGLHFAQKKKYTSTLLWVIIITCLFILYLNIYHLFNSFSH